MLSLSKSKLLDPVVEARQEPVGQYVADVTEQLEHSNEPRNVI